MKLYITETGGTMYQADVDGALVGRGADALVKVDESRTFQEMLGFGVSFTDSSCYVVNQLEKEKRKALMSEIFGEEGLGLNVCRTNVGASDYARTCYSYNDTPDDFEMKNFSIAHDEEYMIPVILEAKKLNPEMFLFSSPWSPPGWMKTGGSMYGGWLRADYVEAFARYYLNYLLAYKKAGITIDALTPQNEVETDQVGKMPASYLHPEYEMAFVRHMAGMLKEHGLTTKMWILDHNYDLWKRADWMLKDSGFKAMTDGVAFHGYGGSANMMEQLKELHPEVHLYWTEGGPDVNNHYYTDLCKWGKIFAEVANNWCRSITAWNLALDEAGRPNIGPFPCGGIVTVDSKTAEISYSAQYWAMGHFSKFVKRGAKRIFTSSSAEGLHQAAFVNPDGGKVIVLTNEGQLRNIAIYVNGEIITIRMNADSMATLVL